MENEELSKEDEYHVDLTQTPSAPVQRKKTAAAKPASPLKEYHDPYKQRD